MDEARLKSHIEACPLGWHDGLLMMSRKSTGKDVIEWLATLREMVGLKGYDSDREGQS